MPEETPDKKPIIPAPKFIIWFITIAKGATEKYLQIILASAMIALSGGVVYGIAQITSMPKKYRQLIILDSIRDIRDKNHERYDSLKDIENINKYSALNHKVDSLQRAYRIRFDRDSTYLAYDFSLLLNHGWVKIKTH